MAGLLKDFLGCQWVDFHNIRQISKVLPPLVLTFQTSNLIFSDNSWSDEMVEPDMNNFYRFGKA